MRVLSLCGDNMSSKWFQNETKSGVSGHNAPQDKAGNPPLVVRNSVFRIIRVNRKTYSELWGTRAVGSRSASSGTTIR
jgi:hypothetical protein